MATHLALFEVVPVGAVHDGHAREAGAYDKGGDMGDVVPVLGLDLIEEEAFGKGDGERRTGGPARGDVG
jgi:hypothetical protein